MCILRKFEFPLFNKNEKNNESYDYIILPWFEMHLILCLILSSKLHVALETFV